MPLSCSLCAQDPPGSCFASEGACVDLAIEDLIMHTAPLSHRSAAHTVHTALVTQGVVMVPCSADHRAAGVAGPNLASALHSQLTFETLGYVFSKELLVALSWLSSAELAHAHANLKTILRQALGAYQVFRPMYPNFPEQVLEASDVELLTNAYLHYMGDWLGLRILPAYVEAPRKVLSKVGKPKVLGLAAEGADVALLAKLLESNVSLSSAQKELLTNLLEMQQGKDRPALVSLLKEAKIPQKEIRALVSGWAIREAEGLFDEAQLARLFGTATDLLRLSVVVGANRLMTADPSLTLAPRFYRFSRAHRRLLLAMLNNVKPEHALAEMFLRREMWLRLGEQLHPGEYAARYSQIAGLFKSLRDKVYPKSWAGQVEKLLSKGRVAPMVEQLRERPGVFARKLHEVFRKATPADWELIKTAFQAVADKVSTPVLVQLRHRFKVSRTQGNAVRAFTHKLGGMWVPPAKVPRVAQAVATWVEELVAEVLTARFAKLPALGNVYVDPKLNGYTIPFGQRSAQKTLKTVARGSRVPLGDANIMRAFLWWNETGVDKRGNAYSVGRTDLDLSCAVLNKDFDYVSHCSFTNLRESGLVHSGDITSAPKGACEFIDIKFDELPEEAAYVALVAYAYTIQNFGDLPEAYLGWMNREDGQSGAIYDARTVQQKVDLTAKGRRVLVGYLDVARREFIWGDLVLPARCDGFNAVETSLDMMAQLGSGLAQPLRPSMGDLLALHVAARGTLVATPEEADLQVLTAGTPSARVMTVHDVERIAADFLA